MPFLRRCHGDRNRTAAPNVAAAGVGGGDNDANDVDGDDDDNSGMHVRLLLVSAQLTWPL